MVQRTYIVKVEMAWWWPLYAHGVAMFAGLMCCEPDWNKVKAMTFRATRLRIVEIKSGAD